MEVFTIPGLVIITAWVLIWLDLAYAGSRSHTLPIHPTLQTLTIGTIVCFIIFYFVSFNGITAFTVTALPTQLVYTVAIITTITGALLLLAARHALPHLSGRDIMFGKNETYTSHGVFRYLSHPMYVGMILMTSGPWLLYPTIVGGLCLGILYGLLIAKVRYE